MSVKVGINGFGRIGKLAFQAALGKGDVEVVAVGLPIGSVFRIVHEYTLIRRIKACLASHSIGPARSLGCPHEHIGRDEAMGIPIVIRTLNVMSVDIDNVCIVTRRVDADVVLPVAVHREEFFGNSRRSGLAVGNGLDILSRHAVELAALK